MKTAGSVFALLVLLNAEPVCADDDIDQDEARRLLQAGKIQPLSALLERHAHRLSGHLLDVELEYDDDDRIPVYEIEVLGEDGVVREFDLDAATGAILKEEVED